MPTNEFLIIKERQRELAYTTTYDADKGEHLSKAIDDGTGCLYWSDINYADEKWSEWEPRSHLRRMVGMLQAGGKERMENDIEWRNKVIGVLRYWLKHDFICPNWWHNEIGTPLDISATVFMLEKYLDESDIKKAVEIISRGSMKYCENADRQAGANLLWAASVTLKHALLYGDESELAYAVKRAESELKFGIEGIQPDGSFYQHGYRWYSAGYGLSFVMEVAPFLHTLDGTSFAFKKENMEIFLVHVLDGLRHMFINNHFDYGAYGREFARKGTGTTRLLFKAVNMLVKCQGIPRRDELLALKNEMCAGGKVTKATNYYYKINVLNQKTDDYYMSVRGTGPRLAGAEHCNGEGVLCYNMSYGTNTCFMKSGREYHDISPVWDYCKIPGTTARVETDESLLNNHGNWHVEVLKDTVADGKVKGDCGIYFQNFKHEDISLKAAYFLYKGNMVCLGADIKDDASEKGDVYTTVEQCIADNPSQISEAIAENSGFVYRNLDRNTSFSMSVSDVCGSWKRNNTYSNLPDETKTVFMLTIPHNCEHDKYAYMVSAKGYETEIEILRNDGVCQAVCFENNTVMAVFHQDGEFEYNDEKYSGNKGELLIFD